MGVAGRDYMRDDGSRPRWSPGRVTWTIIAVNAGLWILFASAVGWGRSGFARPLVPTGGLGGFFYEQLLLHPTQVFAEGKLWQAFTAFWLHDWRGAGHVLVNMLMLFFFGRTAEAHLGGRRMLGLYLGGGLASTLFFTLYAYASGDFLPALGASGAVYAVLVWVACLRPTATVHVMFIFPLPMWFAVGALLVGLEVVDLGSGSPTAGSAVGHLAGAAFGFLFFRFARRWHSERGPGGWIVRLRRKRAKARGRRPGAAADEAAIRARVDALLERIGSEGMGSLSDAEKDFLQEASKRFREGPRV